MSASCAGRLDHRGPRPAVAHRDLARSAGHVGLEPQLAVEPARQTRVHGEEFVDFLLVSGADEAEIKPMHLERDQQLIDRFHADHVGPAVVVSLHQTVELVHEQDPAQ